MLVSEALSSQPREYGVCTIWSSHSFLRQNSRDVAIYKMEISNAGICYIVLQPALLIENIRQPWDALQSSRLLACWRKCDVVEEIQLRLGVAGGLEIEQQIVLDGEHGVVGDPRVVTRIQLSDQRLVTLC